MKQSAVPKPTLGRIPLYLDYLRSLPEDAGENISATIIAKALELGEVQVRKDLGYVIGTGRPKTGHVTRELIRQLECFLGSQDSVPAILVGAGKLGRALLDYDGFQEYGLKIVAAFDVDKEKTGSTETGKSVYSLEELPAFCSAYHVRIGVITVPKEAAQNVCDQMLACGIDAIWSFAPCVLKVPDGVVLQQENLALSLAHLKQQL